MKKKVSFAIIFFAAGIFLAVAISSSAVRQTYRNKKIESEVRTLQEEKQRIQNENEIISQKINYYSTPQFIEKVSKDKINLQKPDENVVIVSQRQVAQDSNNVKDETKEKIDDRKIPNYIKWWKLFF